MSLCENRPEGFGPRSSFTTHLPTTCFADVIVVPLATWVYLALVLLILLISRSLTTTKRDDATSVDNNDRSILGKVMKFIYYFLIIAMLALVSVEIARATVAHLGIGLLPFTYVGLVVASVLHFSAHESNVLRNWGLGRQVSLDTARWRRLIKCVNGLYWILLMSTIAIKLATEAEERHRVGPRTKMQASYPLSDAITDDAVMIGLALALFTSEIFG